MRLYDEEHDLALTLQRSLLPRRAAARPRVRASPSATCRPSERAEIGGDFYEVTLLGDDLLIAVGDVGGHSLHAATVMAELRHATRAYLAEGHAPAAVLDRLNSLMGRLIPGEIATLCLIAIDVDHRPRPAGQRRAPAAADPLRRAGPARSPAIRRCSASRPGRPSTSTSSWAPATCWCSTPTA